MVVDLEKYKKKLEETSKRGAEFKKIKYLVREVDRESRESLGRYTGGAIGSKESFVKGLIVVDNFIKDKKGVETPLLFCNVGYLISLIYKGIGRSLKENLINEEEADKFYNAIEKRADKYLKKITEAEYKTARDIQSANDLINVLEKGKKFEIEESKKTSSQITRKKLEAAT